MNGEERYATSEMAAVKETKEIAVFCKIKLPRLKGGRRLLEVLAQWASFNCDQNV